MKRFAWFLPGPWTPPLNLGAVNTYGAEQRATLSYDGKRLYFGRVPVNGTSDIYVSERKRWSRKLRCRLEGVQQNVRRGRQCRAYCRYRLLQIPHDQPRRLVDQSLSRRIVVKHLGVVQHG